MLTNVKTSHPTAFFDTFVRVLGPRVTMYSGTE